MKQKGAPNVKKRNRNSQNKTVFFCSARYNSTDAVPLCCSVTGRCHSRIDDTETLEHILSNSSWGSNRIHVSLKYIFGHEYQPCYFPANTSIDLAKGLLSSDDSLFARLLQSIVREFGDENNKGEYCKARKVSIEFSPGSIAESSACVAAIACNETLFLFETKLVLILIVLHCSLSLVHDWVEHIQHSSAEIRSRFFQRENSLRVLSYAWQVSSS